MSQLSISHYECIRIHCLLIVDISQKLNSEAGFGDNPVTKLLIERLLTIFVEGELVRQFGKFRHSMLVVIVQLSGK